MNNKENKKSATQVAFERYTREITIAFLDKFGPSYATQSIVRNSWRHKIPYSPEAHQFLILQSIMFLRTLSASDSNSTHPDFLNALTTLMADYLSLYTMQGNINNELGVNKKQIRTAAKNDLKQALFTQCDYINNLFARQKANRAIRTSGRKAMMAERERRKREKALQDYNINRQVMREFSEMQRIHKKH